MDSWKSSLLQYVRQQNMNVSKKQQPNTRVHKSRSDEKYTPQLRHLKFDIIDEKKRNETKE